LTALRDKVSDAPKPLWRPSDGWTYFAYDANGNTVTEQTPSYTRYYDWDGRDMLTGIRSTEQGWRGFRSTMSLRAGRRCHVC